MISLGIRQIYAMSRNSAAELSVSLGDPREAHRITVNLSGEVGSALREVAERCRVSESSIVEIAVRQLFARVGSPALAAFLTEHGACLRRKA
jgi:hypothetical protein